MKISEDQTYTQAQEAFDNFLGWDSFGLTFAMRDAQKIVSGIEEAQISSKLYSLSEHEIQTLYRNIITIKGTLCHQADSALYLEDIEHSDKKIAFVEAIRKLVKDNIEKREFEHRYIDGILHPPRNDIFLCASGSLDEDHHNTRDIHIHMEECLSCQKEFEDDRLNMPSPEWLAALKELIISATQNMRQTTKIPITSLREEQALSKINGTEIFGLTRAKAKGKCRKPQGPSRSI